MSEGLERKQQAASPHLPPASRIAASQFDVPQERGMGFYTEQGIIGPLAAIAWIVANLSALLMAKGCDHRAIQIEEQAQAMLRQVNESLQQSIIRMV